MLQGTYINYDQKSKKTDGLDYSQFKYTNGSELANNTLEMEISKYRLINLVPKQPLQFLAWYTIGKATCQIRAPFIWIDFLGITHNIAVFWHYFILIFGLIGIIKYYLDKNRNKMGTIVFATALYFIIAYLPFYAFERYFYPAIPFMIAFAAYSSTGLIINISKILIKIKSKSFKKNLEI